MAKVVTFPPPGGGSARRSRAASPPPATPAPLTFTDSYGRPRPADTSVPPQPSNLELFVCQRVSAELQPLHDALTAEIEKSWAIARPEEVSHGFNKEKKALMAALNVSEETANELLQKHGGSASAVMMLESGNLGWKSSSDNHDDY